MTGTYDPRLIALSVLLAVLAAFTALNLVQRVALMRGLPERAWLLFGAVATGAGIWSAQVFAMLAFSLPVPVVHHLPTMLFSLGFAVLVCFFPLWIASGPRITGVRLAVTGLCMGIGLAAVHYSGLFAMQIVPAVFYDAKLFTASIAIAAVACWILVWLAFVLRQGRNLPILLARAGAGALIGAGISGMFFAGIAAARFAPDSYSLGAVIGPSPVDGGDRALIILAVGAALLLLAVAMLTSIDHARAPPAPAPGAQQAEAGDVAQLEVRFAELHEGVLSSGHLVALAAITADTAVPAIMQEVGRRLLALVRPGDFVARTAEDEFVLLLAGLGEAGQLERIAGRVREELGREMQLEDETVQLVPRVGTSLCPRDGEDLDTLLRIARAARAQA
jgi:NO-binding membrane sensor protein with MHYT domain